MSFPITPSRPTRARPVSPIPLPGPPTPERPSTSRHRFSTSTLSLQLQSQLSSAPLLPSPPIEDADLVQRSEKWEEEACNEVRKSPAIKNLAIFTRLALDEDQEQELPTVLTPVIPRCFINHSARGQEFWYSRSSASDQGEISSPELPDSPDSHLTSDDESDYYSPNESDGEQEEEEEDDDDGDSDYESDYQDILNSTSSPLQAQSRRIFGGFHRAKLVSSPGRKAKPCFLEIRDLERLSLEFVEHEDDEVGDGEKSRFVTPLPSPSGLKAPWSSMQRCETPRSWERRSEPKECA